MPVDDSGPGGMSPMHLLARPSRNLFFTGKGGVGKTSTACAVAVALATRGRTVLLISTDPASNVDEVFGTGLSLHPTAIAAVPGLSALNVDPETAALEYRERVVGPYRGMLPEAAIQSIEEQFAGACTVEIAAFDEFAKLLGDRARTAGYDHLVFDTAPTGHTLRLLSLPAAWTGFISASTAGTSCIGPLQGMLDQRAVYSAAMQALADAGQTTLVLVSRPDRAALAEAARTSNELRELGVRNQHFVLNGLFTATDRHDPIAMTIEDQARRAVGAMPPALAALPQDRIALRPRQILGVEALRAFFQPVVVPAAPAHPSPPGRHPGIDRLIDRLAEAGHGVIMTMGKGGVGKTSTAVAIARELARRGHAVHLTTTDPAAHVLDRAGTMPANVTVDAIDPATEVARYRAEVMATTGANLDEAGRALLAEDLSSPCTEEVAVFQAFARTVDSAAARFVVVDTAPTGHTILLLDAAQAYHREFERQSRGVSAAVSNLLPLLRDPAFTRILLVTHAEATPVHEAATLQADLRRAGIEPYAWVVNQSLVPLAVTDPVLAARREQEDTYIAEVVREHAQTYFVVPWNARAEAGAGREAEPSLAAVE